MPHDDRNLRTEKPEIAPGRLRMMRLIAEGKVQRRSAEGGQVWEVAGADARGTDKKALKFLDTNRMVEFGGFGGGSHQDVALTPEAAELLRAEEERRG